MGIRHPTLPIPAGSGSVGAVVTKANGLFIVLEGIDGTGKSTQTQRLAEWFRSRGREVVASREPTDGPWGQKIRATAATGRLSPEEELDYFLKDRREHVEQLIAPALAAGKVVILDRYYFSTMAYQGSRGVDPAEIRRLNEEFAPVPDLLVILDLDVDTALTRIGGRGDTANEFEKADSLARCREVFLSLADEPFVHVVPTDAGPDAVQDRIREIAGNHA
ncbi:dTMP kinase [Luteolibacter marinus]|uniref:dTMP kinase n=1 Tax=Luteolibacter marinus TaxID=2776705 RepID=UPI001865C7E4|nr:dTMP kinase [Luteolibacter marinus]